LEKLDQKSFKNSTMRKIITNTFITLDGVIQAPGAPQEDESGNFEFGGWCVNYWDDVMMQAMGELSKSPYDLLLGRKTYEIFAAHWPFIENDPIADQFNKATKYVATNTLKSYTWKNTVLLNDNFTQQIKKIKEDNGADLQVHGSGNMLQTLLKHNLIDEMNIWIFPAVIGKGKKLFDSGVIPSNLKLKQSRISTSGVIITKYVPDGQIPLGSFALEKPTELELERRRKVKKEN
jgi:dihydrofolate reductase